jgi:hypothetical protein
MNMGNSEFQKEAKPKDTENQKAKQFLKLEKSSVISAVVYLVAALVLSLGLATVFKSCSTAEKVMRCHYSTVTVGAVSIFLYTAAIASLFSDALKTKLFIHVVVIETAVINILVPKLLIGGCGMNTMRCQSITFPAIYLTSAILLLFAVINIIYHVATYQKNSEKKKNGTEVTNHAESEE